MLIKNEVKYIDNLILLWKEAFNDEEDYIKLLFETLYKDNVLIFAEFDNDRIVSAFYLINSVIRSGNSLLDGYYLYAAATLKSHRNKGLMGKLIKEAQMYVASEGKAFISLVPGEKYLYSYYEKFGFETVMYRGKDLISSVGKSDKTDYSYISFVDYFEKREGKISVSSHNLCKEAYRYAAKCYEYLGIKAVSTDDFTFIYDVENNCIKELIFENVYNTVNLLPVKGDYTVYSPTGKEKEPFGMVWFFDINKKIENVYMNIALD